MLARPSLAIIIRHNNAFHTNISFNNISLIFGILHFLMFADIADI
jgi:hypothetical protein